MPDLDFLAWEIMNAMADDWESIEQIEPSVRRFHGDVGRPAIFAELRRLHEAGYVRIMDEDGYGVGDFPDSPVTAWFSMTESGRLIWDENGKKYRNE
jgi:hypothetical protein